MSLCLTFRMYYNYQLLCCYLVLPIEEIISSEKSRYRLDNVIRVLNRAIAIPDSTDVMKSYKCKKYMKENRVCFFQM